MSNVGQTATKDDTTKDDTTPMTTGASPTITLSLSPWGHITLELPSVLGANKRHIIMTGGEVEATCRRVLEALQSGAFEIGSDGAPTIAQVAHWEKHTIWARHDCRFCLAEGRIKPQRANQRALAHTIITHGDIKIRKISNTKQTKTKRPIPVVSLSDL